MIYHIIAMIVICSCTVGQYNMEMFNLLIGNEKGVKQCKIFQKIGIALFIINAFFAIGQYYSLLKHI